MKSLNKVLAALLLRIPGTADPVGVLVEGVDEALAVHAPHFDRLIV